VSSPQALNIKLDPIKLNAAKRELIFFIRDLCFLLVQITHSNVTNPLIPSYPFLILKILEPLNSY
jgi:hypothetical protein